MLGYYKDAEKTAESFDEDGFLKTGDMGTMDADGYWFITGCVKDLFKTSKGKYISPVPIEQLLGNHASTESVCVVGNNMTSPLGIVMISEKAWRISMKTLSKNRHEYRASWIYCTTLIKNLRVMNNCLI